MKKNSIKAPSPEHGLSMSVGSEVMIIGGGNAQIRGCIGTISCRKVDPRYVNVFIPHHGKHICHVDELLLQNK